MQSTQTLCYVVITVLFALSMGSAVLRLWVRRFKQSGVFGWDDWVMTSLLVFVPCEQAVLYYFVAAGGGLHMEDFLAKNPQGMTNLLKSLLVQEFVYIWLQFTIKLCFLFLFYRIFKATTHVWILHVILVLHTLFNIAIWLLYGLQCMPLEAFYYPERYPDIKCLPTGLTLFLPYSLNLFIDVAILLYPLPLVLDLNMDLKRRLAVLAALTTGGSAVRCGGLRAIVVKEFAVSPDFTWALGKMILISSVEVHMAVITANTPALKTCYELWRRSKLDSSVKVSSGSGGSGAFGRLAGNGVELTNHSGKKDRLNPTESEEELYMEGPVMRR